MAKGVQTNEDRSSPVPSKAADTREKAAQERLFKRRDEIQEENAERLDEFVSAQEKFDERQDQMRKNANAARRQGGE